MKNISKISTLLNNNKIGVIPTDTLYGVAASAWSKREVERAYKIMDRNKKKPFIILISSIEDLKKFNIKPDKNTENILKQIWLGKVSVILPCSSKKFQYLHRGTKALAFRVPKKTSLIKILRKTGPLISSSANPEGKKPAQTIAEAKRYFGDEIDPVRKTGASESKNVLLKNSLKSPKPKLSNGVDFYINEGKMNSLPSTLVEIKNGKICVIRKGAVKIPKSLLKK